MIPLVLLIGIAAISTASILIKLTDAPALVIAAYRMVFASLLLSPFACHRKIWKRWKTHDAVWLGVSGVFLGLHFAFWIASLKYTSVASSVVLVTTHPIFVGIGSALFLKERLGASLCIGILLSVFGSAWIGLGDVRLSREALVGDGLAVLGAIAASGYLMVGRRLRRETDLLSYIFPVYLAAAGVLVVLSIFFQQPFFGYVPKTYLLFFLLGLVPQLIGHTAFNWALKYLPASLVAVAILGEPVGSTVLAYFILGEGLNLWKICGGISIFAGILIALKEHV